MKYVIIDCDVDYDDIITIIFFLRRRDVRILAITITGNGMVEINPAITIIRKLIYLSGQNIIIGIGKNNSLYDNNLPRIQHSFPKNWKNDTKVKLMNELNDVPETPAILELDASYCINKIASISNKRNIKVIMLNLGPITNLARTFKEYPGITSYFEKIVFMGCAFFDNPGNIAGIPYKEYNTWIDPMALQIVLQFYPSLIIIPLNITDLVPISKELTIHTLQFKYEKTDQLTKLMNISIMSLVGDLRNEKKPVYFWDPLAALIAISSTKELYENTKKIYANINVSIEGRSTVISKGYTEIYMDVNRYWFYDNFYKTVYKT